MPSGNRCFLPWEPSGSHVRAPHAEDDPHSCDAGARVCVFLFSVGAPGDNRPVLCVPASPVAQTAQRLVPGLSTARRPEGGCPPPSARGARLLAPSTHGAHPRAHSRFLATRLSDFILPTDGHVPGIAADDQLLKGARHRPLGVDADRCSTDKDEDTAQAFG